MQRYAPAPALLAGVPLVGDPLDSKQAESVINTAVSQHGRVGGIVNCVGSIVLKSAHTTSDADFDQVCREGLGKGCLGHIQRAQCGEGAGSIVPKPAHTTRDADLARCVAGMVLGVGVWGRGIRYCLVCGRHHK